MNSELVIAAVESIYGAAATPAHWPAALQAVSDCFGDRGAMMIYRRADGSFGTIVSPGLDAAQADYESGEWWRRDIRFSRATERGYFAQTDAITDRHIASADEIETLPYYTQFLHGHDLKWSGGVSISPDPSINVALSVHRSNKMSPLSDGELATLSRLGRHVENGLRFGIRMINAEVSQLALSDLLARLNVGVFLLDRVGRVVFANPAADSFVGDGLLVSSGRLAARMEAPRKALRAAIAWAGEGAAETLGDRPCAVLVPEPERGGFLAVHLLPARPMVGSDIALMAADVAAIAVVTCARPGDPADPSVVRDLLGLTLSEARLAALIGAGISPRTASARLGITEQTARTALKRVFEKTGLTRQSELTALLGRMVIK